MFSLFQFTFLLLFSHFFQVFLLFLNLCLYYPSFSIFSLFQLDERYNENTHKIINDANGRRNGNSAKEVRRSRKDERLLKVPYYKGTRTTQQRRGENSRAHCVWLQGISCNRIPGKTQDTTIPLWLLSAARAKQQRVLGYGEEWYIKRWEMMRSPGGILNFIC